MHYEHSRRQSATIGERLRMARQATGLSTRVVADRLGSVCQVSHATLANYERDLTRPPINVMVALATLYERPLDWFLGHGAILSGIRYRNLKSKVGVKDRHRFEGYCQRWLDAYAAIERHLDEELTRSITFESDAGESPSRVAQRLRETLGLDESDAISSVVDILEGMAIRVIEVETDLDVDGLAAQRGEEHVVVVNGRVSNDRSRMNSAHELGHVLLGHCSTSQLDQRDEDMAFAFASNLLLTRRMLHEAFRRKSVVDLVKFKERFGISLAAMVYRAEREHLLRPGEAKRLWIEFGKRGWRTREPGRVRADRPLRFEAIVDSALVSGRSSLFELANIGGVRECDLRHRVALATGADSYDAPAPNSQDRFGGLRIVR